MREVVKQVYSGWLMLFFVAAFGALSVYQFFFGLNRGDGVSIGFAAVLQVLFIFMAKGLFILQPNEARVLVFFGQYVGTVKKAGFHWANPFSVIRGPFQVAAQQGKGEAAALKPKPRYKVSLRVRNFETQSLKVNDLRGNPIEIGAVVVWRVQDTAKALFDVDDYEHYVKVQSETALRHLANTHPYDHGEGEEEEEITLRDSTDAVALALKKELEARLKDAGVMIEEARLTHLAYSPEIAGVMLKRQQAEAIIAARHKIVHGAVSMVEMALAELSEKKVVALDEEKKAEMVSNLLVVLCAESEVEPVINTGGRRS